MQQGLYGNFAQTSWCLVGYSNLPACSLVTKSRAIYMHLDRQIQSARRIRSAQHHLQRAAAGASHPCVPHRDLTDLPSSVRAFSWAVKAYPFAMSPLCGDCSILEERVMIAKFPHQSYLLFCFNVLGTNRGPTDRVELLLHIKKALNDMSGGCKRFPT